ncbi:MAG: hypothetical protein GY715_20100 [Planctomycetes bacterium]|nr:hypothetical protein [Planctomycetota bacterium]
MQTDESQSELEITEDQVQALRELGVPEQDLQGMSMAEADALIDELRAEREALIS